MKNRNCMRCYKIILLGAMLIFGESYTSFSSTIAYNFKLPARSTWGLFNTGSYEGSTLAQSAGVSDLVGCTIFNNKGAAGNIKGQASEVVLAPSLPEGVTYTNPLSIINQAQPCIAQSFVAQTITDSACQSPEILMVDSTTGNLLSSSQDYVNTLTERYHNALTKIDDSLSPYYKKLYAQLVRDVQALQAIKDGIKQDTSFFSVLYLKFAAMYGNQFVNQQALQKANDEYFGNDIDMSAYFEGNIFPVVADIAMVANLNQNNSLESTSQNVSIAMSSGPLVRAYSQGLLKSKTLDASVLIEQPPLTNATAILELLSTKPTSSQVLALRARVTELFFMYMGLLLGSNCIAGAPTYDSNYCSDSSCPGNAWCPIEAPCQKMSSAPFSFYRQDAQHCFPQLCSKLAASARYMYLIADQESDRKEAVIQPIDTFYGMIVINQSSYTITSNASLVQPGQIGVLAGSPGVDVWDVAGINKESGYKYRSLPCNIVKGNQARSVVLNIEETFDVNTYNPSQLYLPVMTFINEINNTQQDISRRDYLQKFFSYDRSAGWAVVMQMTEQANDSGSFDLIFNLVGLARLNQYDFPLVYRADGLETYGVGPFTSAQLLEAPFMVWAKIVASQNKGQPWQLCSTVTPPEWTPIAPIQVSPLTVSVGDNVTKQISPVPLNPYYIMYKSSLSADFGGATTLQSLLSETMTVLKKSYITLDTFKTVAASSGNLFTSPFLTFVSNATQDPRNNVVQIFTTKTYTLEKE